MRVPPLCAGVACDVEGNILVADYGTAPFSAAPWPPFLPLFFIETVVKNKMHMCTGDAPPFTVHRVGHTWHVREVHRVGHRWHVREVKHQNLYENVASVNTKTVE